MGKTWNYFKIVQKFGYTEYKDPNTFIITSITPWTKLWIDLYMGIECVDMETNQKIKYNNQFTTILKKPVNKTTFQNYQMFYNSGFRRNNLIRKHWSFFKITDDYPKSRSKI